MAHRSPVAVSLDAPSSQCERPATPDPAGQRPRSATPVGGRDDAGPLRAGGAARTLASKLESRSAYRTRRIGPRPAPDLERPGPLSRRTTAAGNVAGTNRSDG